MQSLSLAQWHRCADGWDAARLRRGHGALATHLTDRVGQFLKFSYQLIAPVRSVGYGPKPHVMHGDGTTTTECEFVVCALSLSALKRGAAVAGDGPSFDPLLSA